MLNANRPRLDAGDAKVRAAVKLMLADAGEQPERQARATRAMAHNLRNPTSVAQSALTVSAVNGDGANEPLAGYSAGQLRAYLLQLRVECREWRLKLRTSEDALAKANARIAELETTIKTLG